MNKKLNKIFHHVRLAGQLTRRVKEDPSWAVKYINSLKLENETLKKQKIDWQTGSPPKKQGKSIIVKKATRDNDFPFYYEVWFFHNCLWYKEYYGKNIGENDILGWAEID